MGSLCSLIRKGGLNVREARRIFKCIVKAVGYLHYKGLVHWGIRSERILLENICAPHRPRLVGFGNAKRFERGRKLELLPHFHYMMERRFEDDERIQGDVVDDGRENGGRRDDDGGFLKSVKDDCDSPGMVSRPSSDSLDSGQVGRMFSAYSSHYDSNRQFNNNSDSFSSSSSIPLSIHTVVDPHFASPEMLSGTAGTFPGECDIWTLGILLFEMLFGYLPFTSSRGWDFVAASVLSYANLTPTQRYAKLFAKTPDTNLPLLNDAKDLIIKLLHPTPEMRISPHKCLQHEFFARTLIGGEGDDRGVGNFVMRREGMREAVAGRTQSAHARTGGGMLFRGGAAAGEAQVRRFSSL